ncbi:MAG TPA: hypothetical protein ENJ04_03740 [Nitrospirae bacterium]|nr:hypothetical protein [Nitrospirota bacterium]
MKCPFLREWMASPCRAGDTPYVPSGFQLTEYCRSTDHRKCPFFSDRHGRRKDTQAAGPA